MDCPQGSVLGPTLWNCVVDLFSATELPEGIQVFAYADDIAMVVTSNVRAELRICAQEELNLLDKWADECKLTISTKTINILVNKLPARVHHRDLHLRINVNTKILFL